MVKNDWREEAWDEFLKLKWDSRKPGLEIVKYNKEDLYPILNKYPLSGQGEIRIFHYEHEKVDAVKRRGVMKIPISRSEWAIVKRPEPVLFAEPKEIINFNPKRALTEGMMAGIKDCETAQTNPGEPTLLAIANHIGIISDFYGLDHEGTLFTAGRQNASGCKLLICNTSLDLSSAQIEIDGGYEWPEVVVLVEMKSSFKQDDFDLNQCLIPYLKWKSLISTKKIYSMVLLAEVERGKIVYYAYDLTSEDCAPLAMRIVKSMKYIVITSSIENPKTDATKTTVLE